MAFWQKPILTRHRKKALDEFRRKAVAALNDLERRTKNPVVKNLYRQMAVSVSKTPIYFYPRHNLREKIYGTMGRLSVAVTKGENINVIKIVQQGPHKFLVRDNYINLPSEHIFVGDRLSIDGIFTLAHEYAHFQKGLIRPFAQAYGLSLRQAEELMADVLAAKLAVTMGFPRHKVLGHFAGREIVYGGFPFWQFIEKALV